MNDTNPTLGEATYEYTYDAPRELVFECMTTAEHLCHFWGPIGMSTPIENIIVEPHAGGSASVPRLTGPGWAALISPNG